MLNIKENKKDFLRNDSNTIYQITSSYNQNNNEYENLSSILLGDCENKLREYYHIIEEDLLIFKVDFFEEGLLIPLIKYEIYNPLTLEPLNLTICKDTKIQLSIPVKINEDELFLYTSSHDYYNDICYTYTTKNGTDIIVKDRQNEYIKNNLSLCESNCEYAYYDSIKKKTICKCKPSTENKTINEILDNKDKLLKAFKDLKNAKFRYNEML